MNLKRIRNDVLLFAAFVGLTIVMTWPWLAHIRDAAPDKGDSYFGAWTLWWDYHQTFHDPLQLFQANILYPYRYTLAFSEHDYGIALFFFPLYALGIKPLTVAGVATLIGFAFSGYGAFRLARTLTASTNAAWIAGVAFAFVPYRFHHLPHVIYLFSGWMPLMLEALILYTRAPTRKRAAWLGVAFFMNALTCIHWLVLTSIPLILTALFLITLRGLWRHPRFWLRGLVALALAMIGIAPFLVPYLRVSKLYGLVRDVDQVRFFSAHLINWLTIDWRNKLWAGLVNAHANYQTELALFPGMLPIILVLVLFVLSGRKDFVGMKRYRAWCAGLSGILMILFLVIGLLTIGYGSLHSRIFGFGFTISNPAGPLLIALAALILRLILGPPKFLDRIRAGTGHGLHASEANESVVIGLIWLVTGFVGSLGLNTIFHRTLFNYVLPFRSIRVPARWAMICYVGSSLLAALGAIKLIDQLIGVRAKKLVPVAGALVVGLFLFEQRVVPLDLIKGDVDPDAVTLRLRETTMKGGIVELPAGVDEANYLYTLRAADHARPLVNGVSGFRPLIIQGVEEMSQRRPIPNEFFDLLEAIPVSYLVVHDAALDDQSRAAVNEFLHQGLASGRLRAIQLGQTSGSDALYAVTRVEPQATKDSGSQ